MRLPYFLLVFFSLVDFFSTKFLISQSDINSELNPVMRFSSVVSGSIYGILWIKLLVLLFAGLGAYYLYITKKYPVNRLVKMLWLTMSAQGGIAAYGTFLAVKNL